MLNKNHADVKKITFNHELKHKHKTCSTQKHLIKTQQALKDRF